MEKAMSNYRIVTDSASDMGEHLKDWGVASVSLTLKFDGDDTVQKNDEVEPVAFYNRMREGACAKTSAVNPEGFIEVFEPILVAGDDILYIGFSSGLSTTCNSGRIAAEKLMEKYPERKITVIDSLSASAGFGMLVYLAVKKKNEGATLDENAEYVTSLIPHMCHWFTVDDLVYLKRGGRISPTVAFVGGVLGIKPVLHMDNEGHLVNQFKVRGRRAAVKALADKLGELMTDKSQGPVFICHADCEGDAALLSSMIKETYGLDTDITVFTGPVIGAHSGPGTLALFFIGNER
jgi:DegV family protein with EDD domain